MLYLWKPKFLPPIAPFGVSTDLKASGPYSRLFFVGHYYVSGVWLGVDPTTNTKRHVLKKDCTAHSKFVNHSTVNNQQIDKTYMTI